MSLSDVCSEYQQAQNEAAEKMAEGARRYAAPDYPLQYGPEADTLRRLGEHLADSDRPDPETVALVVRIAHAVLEINSRPDVVNGRELRLMLNVLAESVRSDLGRAEGAGDNPNSDRGT